MYTKEELNPLTTKKPVGAIGIFDGSFTAYLCGGG
jgi:hypothetical protein